MDKNAIRKYAVWARRELIDRVSQRALQYGITEDNYGNPDDDSVNGVILSNIEKRQRRALIEEINKNGYEHVIEEVAYTWFNRFTALRFMEVNGYLQSRVRVFTDENNNFKPQILDEALDLDIEGLDMDIIYDLKDDATKEEELYKYLLIKQCNALNTALPKMFQKIADYTELLFPENLLREGSVIHQMIELIDDKDWKDTVEIIGWLYQYYNTELNQIIYDGSMKKSRINKDLLPAATTMYTPDWVVKYMVENSLGKLWIEGHPHDQIKLNWKYYIEDVEQSEDVRIQLDEIHKKYKGIKPDEIRVIDPCSGSGHILVYFFDILMQIYESYGYTTNKSVESIIENNIYGLDIDNRAAQIAYFAVMMRARKYDRMFFKRRDDSGNIVVPQANIYSIKESNNIDSFIIEYFCNGDKNIQNDIEYLLFSMRDAKEYGSLIKIANVNFKAIYKRFEEIKNDYNLNKEATLNILLPIVKIAEILSNEYDVVVTNPPYLGNPRFGTKLDKYIKEFYYDEKFDLSLAMLKRSLDGFSKKDGFVSFITTSSWMYLSSFEKLRFFMINNICIDSLVDFGTELFDGKIGHNPIVAWVNRNSKINKNGTAIRLVDYCYSNRNQKEPQFFNSDNRYIFNSTKFTKISGFCISSYWGDEKIIENFSIREKIGDIAYPKQGLATADNNRFLRLWFEVDKNSIGLNCISCNDARNSKKKWFPYNKGGSYKKWYGNNEYLVNWENNGFEICNFRDHKGKQKSRPQNIAWFFKQGLSWSKVTSSSFSMRYIPNGFLFDVAGCTLFTEEKDMKYILGYMNSKVNQYTLKLISQTLNFEVGHIASIPIIFNESYREEVEELVDENIILCKNDWDDYEKSWDFKKNPLTSKKGSLKEIYEEYVNKKESYFIKLKENEEKLNKIFLNIYEVDNVLKPEILDEDITISKADYTKDIKSLISYAVGCMFGRYSLDCDGVICTGQNLNHTKYVSYNVDLDNIIPICSDEYFEDDIVGKFIEFISVVYGNNYLEENLQFIANALGGKGTPRSIIREYFINKFYIDHCNQYSSRGAGKRPIYWLFDSGKKNGFKALIYMHRYKSDTIARMRTDYVHEQQERYRNVLADLQQRMKDASSSERVKIDKKITKIQEQIIEIANYEEKIHHLADQMISIDLDDGVKHNYEIFKNVLAKIK